MKLNINVFWYLLIFALLIVLTGVIFGCSCNYHLKRVALKCNITHFQDTILIHDTVLIPQVHHDTLFSSKIGDTIYINKDRLHIKYVRLPGDSVYIQGKCDTVFINRFIKVGYEKTIIKKPTWWENNQWWVWVLLILLAGGFVCKKIVGLYQH